MLVRMRVDFGPRQGSEGLCQPFSARSFWATAVAVEERGCNRFLGELGVMVRQAGCAGAGAISSWGLRNTDVGKGQDSSTGCTEGTKTPCLPPAVPEQGSNTIRCGF